MESDPIDLFRESALRVHSLPTNRLKNGVLIKPFRAHLGTNFKHNVVTFTGLRRLQFAQCGIHQKKKDIHKLDGCLGCWVVGLLGCWVVGWLGGWVVG